MKLLSTWALPVLVLVGFGCRPSTPVPVVRATPPPAPPAPALAPPEPTATPVDPLVSGKHLSDWIASLDDRDPQVEENALTAIGKLKREEATRARIPLAQLSARTTNNLVAAHTEYLRYILFHDLDSSRTPLLLGTVTGDEVRFSNYALLVLQRYQDRAEQIAAVAVRWITDPAISDGQKADALQLVGFFPETAKVKLDQAKGTGDAKQDVPLTLAREKVEKLLRLKAAGIELTPPQLALGVSPQSAPPATDWKGMTAQARESAQAWERRGIALNSQYATAFAHLPRDVFMPLHSNDEINRAVDDEERFHLWDTKGKEWRAYSQEIERRIKTDR